VPVEAQPVSRGPVASEVSAVGTLRSNESVVIRPEIDARVTDIHFDEGRAVEAGTLLFSFDDSIARAELADAEASLALSERNFKRAEELFRRGAGTARSVDEARASLDSDRAKVALARARLDKTQISAPFAGIVGLRRVSIGDYVSSGEDLVNLESIDPIKVDFRIPERHLGGLHAGQELELEVDAFPGQRFRGRVFAVDPQIDPGGRSIALRAEVPNPDGLLRPGLFSRIRLVLDVRPNAITIPEQAIVPLGDERYVFTVVDGRAVKTRITLGQRGPGWVEVTEGLALGDVVVTAGQLKIREGSSVEVVAPALAAPGTGA
jgi:membrane fusion protein (multidrug efflux system)